MSKRFNPTINNQPERIEQAAQFQRLAPQLADYPNLPTATTEIILDAFSVASGVGYPSAYVADDPWGDMAMPAGGGLRRLYGSARERR